MIRQTEYKSIQQIDTKRYDQGMDSRNKIDMNIMDESSSEDMIDMNNTGRKI